MRYVLVPQENATVSYTAIPFVARVAFAKFQCTVDGTTYTFRQRWNSLSSRWFVDLMTDDEQPIMMSMCVVMGVALGRTSTHRFFREGALYAVNTSRSKGDVGREATFDDLGLRVEIRRFTLEQLYAYYGYKRVLVP